MKTVDEINWLDPADRITQRFTVHEALWLPSWRTYAVPTAEQKANVVAMAARMEMVRSFVNAPIHVHCWLRPKDYNATIKGSSPNSAHIEGKAVDFHVGASVGADTCARVRRIVEPLLDVWKLRMEDHDGPWIHLDCRDVPPGGKRFFKP